MIINQTIKTDITNVIGNLPYRMAFAGGWIDQPFVSRHNPTPPGSMVVVSLKPTMRFMDRCGMGTSTRNVADKIWAGRLPDGDPEELVRELYAAENEGKAEPSGSQDMAGIIYPGINRLDYDFNFEGGYFPVHVETNRDPVVIHWLESVVHIIPVAQRPLGYSPLGEQNLDPRWISELGQTGKDCFDAIINQDTRALGASMNKCMLCWQAIFPHTVQHPTIAMDLPELLGYYQSCYPGAMYSGCGGGYLFVVSEEKIPGAFQVSINITK
jgi:hypothetical protein